MINQGSYSDNVAEELGLQCTAYASDVATETSLESTAYASDVATAINGGQVVTPTLRVLQYNIGHFNMGKAAAPLGSPSTSSVLISSEKSDGYPSSLDRNYATQLQRWKARISGINADIISMPEWNDYFGYNGGSVVRTDETGIFEGYSLSVGPIECSGWWINTLASKLIMSNSENVYLGSTAAPKAYVRVASVMIDGNLVKVGSTHLNWNQASGYYESRMKEIKELVKYFDSFPYVILCGDFNTMGHYQQNDYLAGLQEYDPFVNGFTEDGITYNGGFTLANTTTNPLLTANATNSRPDLGASKNYPYQYLDNIIVKGFTMSNIQVVDDGTLTDHCALYCDLTII